MKYIHLTNGGMAIIDKEFFESFSKYRWQQSASGYAYRGEYLGNYKNATYYMHKLILDNPHTMQVDHINGNKLDNRRSNLRLCSPSQNSINTYKRKQLGLTSRFKGVSFWTHKRGYSYWRARNNKKWLGYFKTEKEAAIAYDKYVKERYGKFARLNYPNQE